MARVWRLFARRVDAMSLRERIMMLLAASALAYSVLDTFVVSPPLARIRFTEQEVKQRQTDVRSMAEHLRTMTQARAKDPDEANRRKLKEVSERLALVDRELEEQSRVLIAPERMRGILQHVLASRAGLQLVELKTLPQVALGLSPGIAKMPSGGPPNADVAPQAVLYKHGFELTLRGGYLDLLGYLRGLEAMPERLYWDKLQLSVGKHPVATMTLTIYTVSMDKGWLQV